MRKEEDEGRERERGGGVRDKGKSNLRFPTLPLFTYEHVHAAGPELLSCHFQSGLCACVYILQGPRLPALGCPLGTVLYWRDCNVLASFVQTEKESERGRKWNALS